MISYIKGILNYSTDQYMIVETGGIGYQIFVSPLLLAKLPSRGEEVKIYTHMNVKEDGISLFGFWSIEEVTIFQKLITVNGVGPKAALSFFSVLSAEEIIMAVLSDDIQSLSKAPGVGKKTAQRVILDLKDKLKIGDDLAFMDGMLEEEAKPEKTGRKPKMETIEALSALGYSRSEAAKAVNEVFQDGISTEELLKLALKKMI